ncbi:MAG: hypothetical protein V4561_12520 [Bacteroidota bacterium]
MKKVHARATSIVLPAKTVSIVRTVQRKEVHVAFVNSKLDNSGCQCIGNLKYWILLFISGLQIRFIIGSEFPPENPEQLE